jgi:branched-subunit amino acid aminotransferase/4-amino-4-deoxychorismate lyase
VYAEIDGRPVPPERLGVPSLVDFGHFTAMQVRASRVRGLGLHLARLAAANRELFDAPLDGDRVRHLVRHALAGTADASVRVSVFRPPEAADPSILVTVRPPAHPPSVPQRLKSVPYLRPVAHVKHLGDFGQTYYGRLARRAGFDDCLLTGPGGVVAEAGIANVVFFDGAAFVWPDAPILAGITMQLLEPRLPSRRAEVRLADLGAFTAAFVTNSRGVAPVALVDDRAIPVDPALLERLRDVYEETPADPL